MLAVCLAVLAMLSLALGAKFLPGPRLIPFVDNMFYERPCHDFNATSSACIGP